MLLVASIAVSYLVYHLAVRTQSVDVTITNLLEGVVAYDALPPPQTQKSQTSPHTPSSVPSLKSTDLRPHMCYSPAMETVARQLSLEERKKQLLDNARRYSFIRLQKEFYSCGFRPTGSISRNMDWLGYDTTFYFSDSKMPVIV